MKSLSRYTLAALALAAATLFSACSKDDTALQSTIPTDVLAVASIDGEKVMKAIGAEMKDSEIILPQELSNNREMEFVNTLSSVAANIDYKSIYLVVDNSRFAFFTFTITDADGFAKVLTDECEAEETKASGFESAYTLSSPSAMVVIDGNQGWLMGDRDLDNLKGCLKRAEKSAISEVEGLADALAADGLAKILVTGDPARLSSSGTGINNPKAPWNYMCVNADDDALVLTGCTYDADGNVSEVKGMQTIATDFLRYIPSDFNVVVACGLTPEFDWSTVSTLAGTGGFRSSGMMEAALPILKSIDGTIAFGMKYDLTDPYASAPAMLAMVHLPQAKINETVETFSSMFTGMGVTPQSAGAGLYKVSDSSAQVIYGSLDGYFVASTIDISDQNSNTLTQLFEGKDMAASVKLGNLPRCQGICNDVELQMSMADDSYKAVLSFPGTERPVGLTLLLLLTAI